MSEILYDSIDEIIEDIDAEIISEIEDVVTHLSNFSKSIANIDNAEYDSKKFKNFVADIQDAERNSKILLKDIKKLKSEADSLELLASIKRNPQTNSEEDDERDD